MPAARRERASAVKSSPAALRTKSGCFVQWQLRLRTTEGEGTSRRSTTSIAEMRAHPASATQPWPSPSTQQRDQSIERLQRQSKSARRTSIRNAGAQSAVFGSPRRLASTNDVARRSWIRRGPDQGAFPPARSMGEHSAEAKSQRPDLLWPVSVSRAELGCALMSPFPKICREFYRAFHP